MTYAADREPRTSVMLRCILSIPDRTTGVTEHRVRNLSATGCRIDNASGLTIGDRRLLAVGALEGIAAEVIWNDGIHAGLRFEGTVLVSLAHARPKPNVVSRDWHVAAKALIKSGV